MKRSSISVCIVNSLTGKVVQRISAEPSLLVADVKLQVASAVRVLAPEVLLTLAGRPLCSAEPLSELAEGNSALELGFRKAEPQWLTALEEVGVACAAFERHHRQHQVQMKGVLATNRERSSTLTQLSTDMKQAFKNKLLSVNNSGNNLLLAAGDLQRNRDIVFDLVPRSSKGTRQAAEELRLCRESVLASVQANGVTLASLKGALETPKTAVLIGLRDSAAALQNAQEALRREGELLHLAKARGWLFAETASDLERKYRTVLESVCDDGKALASVSEEVRKCRESYRRAVAVNGNAVRHAFTSLKQDQEIVFGWALDHVSEMRKCDRNFILSVVEANGEALERAPAEFKSDREIVMTAVSQSNGWALQFADTSLRHDRELVLTAVRRNGWALEYAAPELKEDFDVVMAAVQANGEALEHAAETLRNNKEVVLAAVKRSNGFALQAASKAMQLDREVVLSALAQNGRVLEHVAPELKCDLEVVKTAVKVSGLALEYASEKMQSNREVVLIAVKQNPWALKYVSESLRGDRGVVTECIQQDGSCLMFASEEMRADRALVLIAIYQSGAMVLQFAAKELAQDEDIMHETLNCRSRQLKAQRENGDPSWSPRPETYDQSSSSIVTL